jgi:hypothetical protein
MHKPFTPSLSFWSGLLRIIVILVTILAAIIYLAVKFFLWKERR